MQVKEIHKQVNAWKNEGKKMFVTSSFQTHSIPLLHLLSHSGIQVDVLFLNTGFLFPQTLMFRDELAFKLGLHLIEVKSISSKHLQKDGQGQFYFVSDPDYCCFLNKTQPMDAYLTQYDIWINGVRADQTETRSKMSTTQEAPHNTLRFHPMLDWSAKMIYAYRMEHELPEHPLDKEGYQSIGCVPCTRKIDLNDERSARWYGMNKTECGLHTDLIK